ncbi:FUSC family protein, partial [Kitasatospora sp. NPDC094019]|uniref:FUSC family protein n=1 Tax=Kitasatospora sp. NPDC094019 TaxID=3364091 RepID=UPI00382E651A
RHVKTRHDPEFYQTHQPTTEPPQDPNPEQPLGRPFIGHRAERALLVQCLASCIEVMEPSSAGEAGVAKRHNLQNILERIRHTGVVSGSSMLARHLPGMIALSELALTAGVQSWEVSSRVLQRLSEEGSKLAALGPDRTDSSVSRPWPKAVRPLDARVTRAARSAVEPSFGRAKGSASPTQQLARYRWSVVQVTLTDTQSWRCGLGVGLALMLAGTIAQNLQLPHPYWAALTVTFVCRPDLGPVTGRAVERLSGTAVGLLFSWLVFSCTGSPWVLVTALALATGLIPALAATGYLYQTAALVTVVMMATQIAGEPGLDLLVPNLCNCALGCLTSVASCALLCRRVRDRTLARHLRRADARSVPAPVLPSCEFRGADAMDFSWAPAKHLKIARARAELDRARREPPRRHTRITNWEALIEDEELHLDAELAAHTAKHVGAMNRRRSVET